MEIGVTGKNKQTIRAMIDLHESTPPNKNSKVFENSGKQTSKTPNKRYEKMNNDSESPQQKLKLSNSPKKLTNIKLYDSHSEGQTVELKLKDMKEQEREKKSKIRDSLKNLFCCSSQERGD